MTTTSTKSRHKRNAELVAAWRHPIGTRVVVDRDNGETLETVTTSEAFLLNGLHALIQVRGIPGNTALSRVTHSLTKVTETQPPGSLGADVASARVKAQLSVRMLAKMAGVSAAYVSRIETGHELRPSEEALCAIASALGIDTDALLLKAGRVPRDICERLMAHPERWAEIRDGWAI